MDAMDFSVNAKALTGLVDMLDNRAADLASASSYLDEHSHPTFGAGLINELCRSHERIMAEVEGFLHRAGQGYCQAYSTGVDRAVQAYNTTDQATSARIDATLPGVVDPTRPDRQADQQVGPEIFYDRFPLRLAIPPDFSAQYPYQPSWFDLISPSSITRDVIWGASWLLSKLGLLDRPWDPFQAITEPICGDWAGLETVSFALRQVVAALKYVSDHVDGGAGTLDRVWTGHAAGNCHSALQRFARDLGPAQGLVNQIADQYHQVAEAARKQGEILATAVTLLVDCAASFGMEFGAQMAVDAILDGTRLARYAAQLKELIEELSEGIELLHAVIEGAHVDIDALTGQLPLLFPWPLYVNMPDDLPALPVPLHHR
jgi:hypothetical protein